MGWRLIRELLCPAAGAAGQRVLIIGAGDAGEALCRQILSKPQMGLRVAGFIDADPMLQRRRIHGVEVLGRIVQLREIAGAMRVKEVLIAIPSLNWMQMRQMHRSIQAAGLAARTLPSVAEIVGGKVRIDQIRKVDISDVLGRRPVRIDQTAVANLLKGKCVLVTGAGGSIGSELCRQILAFQPA